MPTICPGCYRAIGDTPHCATCRVHNDPVQHCYCPECNPDAYRDDESDPNAGSLLTGCWHPEGQCTCDLDAFHRSENA